jgi:hypothetical protein
MRQLALNATWTQNSAKLFDTPKGPCPEKPLLAAAIKAREQANIGISSSTFLERGCTYTAGLVINFLEPACLPAAVTSVHDQANLAADNFPLLGLITKCLHSLHVSCSEMEWFPDTVAMLAKAKSSRRD